jgi:hypothetical protein
MPEDPAKKSYFQRYVKWGAMAPARRLVRHYQKGAGYIINLI